MKTNQMRKAKAIYLGLALARKSATVPRVSAETRRQAEEWGCFIVVKREGCRDTLIGSCWPGEAVGTPTRWGIRCDWLGVHIWLSLISTKLEVGTKIKEAVSY